MANEEQLAILKQGVDVWNKWRDENPSLKIYLSRSNLWKMNLIGANFSEAYLAGANLNESALSQANLTKADLSQAHLSLAELDGADFTWASLGEANFNRANLNNANLSMAYLGETILAEANFKKANISEATMGGTIFGKIDLSEVIGFDKINHLRSSTIGIDTLQLSKGKIPDVFLRGCGLSDFEIESARLYNPDLTNQEINTILYKIYDLRARQSIQVSPLFISYNHIDAAFVDRLEIELNKKGIRFWRDIHDAKAGRLELQIEQAIRHNPTVLLVLSKDALESDWVQHEVRKARGLEKELGRDVLCPVALDDSWKSARWPERMMAQVTEYNVLDFSQWRDETVFQGMFVKLLDGLQLFYKKS